MKYYQEITLLPDEDISVNFLLSKVYQKLHLAIVDGRKNNPKTQYAVAFPEYSDITLGEKIRVFSNSLEFIDRLKLNDYLKNMSDYVHITRAKEIPAKKIGGNIVFCRHRPAANPEALARRYARRHDCSYEEAVSRYKRNEASSKLPYIMMQSRSTGQMFSLFIRKKEVTNKEKAVFDCYGLGDGAGVPDF